MKTYTMPHEDLSLSQHHSSDPSNHCDLCGNASFTIVSKTDRRGEALTTGLCQQCGLVSHLPLPSEKDIAAYYANDYRRDYHGDPTPAPRRIMRAWNNGERLVRQVSSYLSEQAKVFEIGAGIGCNVKAFETHGFSASGIEPNKDFNSYTRNTLHAAVDNQNLYDLEATHAQDMVLLIHVIEHFTSPTRALNHMRGLLKDDGLLYIECPNVAAPFATFGRLFHFAHIYNFTPETLMSLAHRCGFEKVEAFSDDAHPDIQILFRKAGSAIDAPFKADVADRVHHAMQRYGWLSYHLRGTYLQRRLCKLISYAKEHLVAKSFVRKLEDRFKT